MKNTTGRIGSAFERLRREGRKALITYIMAGAPSEGETLELIALLGQNGADIIELGVPFSDPVADGPVSSVLPRQRLLKARLFAPR